jgi:hypothetical protein
MKKYLIGVRILQIMIIILSLSSCVPSNSLFPITGNGKLKSEDRALSEFHAIKVSGGFDVKLVAAESEGLTLTADENLFDYIVTEVVNGELRVYTTKNFMDTKSLNVRISYKKIDGIDLSGGGDLSGENKLVTEKLDVEISGGGDMDLDLDAEAFNCSMSGGGDVKLAGKTEVFNLHVSGGGDLSSSIEAESINCSMSGGGDIRMKETAEGKEARFDLNGGGNLDLEINTLNLECSLSGGGDASIEGKAGNLDISINGGGNFEASRLQTEKTHFSASGGSNIHLNVKDELTGTINGGGDVYFSGNPPKVDVDARGGSEVHKE